MTDLEKHCKLINQNICIIESLYITLHDVDAGYRIVEPKDINEHDYLIRSGDDVLIDEKLANEIITRFGGATILEKVKVFRPKTGFSTNRFVLLEVSSTCSWQDLETFQPKGINLLNETNAWFFCRKSMELLISETWNFKMHYAIPGLIPVQ